MKAIIKSVLDLDRYKLTMGQFVFFKYRDVEVEYTFTNRTKDEDVRSILITLFPFIQSQISLLKTLRLSFSEMLYMQSVGIYSKEYINFLSQLDLNDVTFELSESDNQELNIKYSGSWSKSILFETYILSIVSELYSRAIAYKKFCTDNLVDYDLVTYIKVLNGDEELLKQINKPYQQEAIKKLDSKILILKNHPEIKFFDFSTRRRFSQDLQEQIILKLSTEIHKTQFTGVSQFLGTSNEYLGFKHGLKVGGTYAHEMLQVVTALAEPFGEKKMINAQYDFMREWNQFYGYDLSVGLTDTFGSDAFFKDCPEDIAKMYSFREDSATDLYKYTNDVLDLYKKYNVPHYEKVIVHSNGLDINKVIEINSFSQNKINKIYGIGTNLGNDVGNEYKNISIVIKATKANGIDTVKLSDNLSKAIGKKEKIEQYKRIFGYTNKESIEQIY